MERQYDVLHALLPRYMRVLETSARSVSAVVTALRQKLSNEAHAGLVQTVLWMRSCSFLCVPGYVAINELEPMALGLFPLDIASACSANALGLLLSDACKRPATVLDLCCCPGGKLQCILDGVGSDALVVGVDVSQPRLDVCKSLLDKKARFLCEQRGPENDGLPWRARHVLFRCDGTQFGATSLGALVFDSSVQHEELTALFRQHENFVQRRTSASGRVQGLTVGDESCDGIDDGASRRGHSTASERGPANDTASAGGVSLGSAGLESAATAATVGGIGSSGGGGGGGSGGGAGMRKRKNKSARQREEKRLKRIEHDALGTLLATFDRRPACDGDGNGDGNGDGDGDGDGGVAPSHGGGSSPDLRHYFDYVLVDAECSHDGSYRHMRYVTPQPGDQQHAVDAVERLQKPGAAASFHGPDRSSAAIVQLQRQLLANGFRLLRPSAADDDGASALVYSTCSLEEEQNEGVVRWFLGEHSDAELVPLSADDLFGPTSTAAAADGPAAGAEDMCAFSDIEGADLERAWQLLRSPLSGDALVPVPAPAAFTPSADDRHLPTTTQHLRHYSRLLCRHIANLTRPPGVSPDSASTSPPSSLAGTVRLSKEQGTSGLFIAKFRKKNTP